MNNRCMTLDELRELNQRAHYVNFSTSVLQIAADRLSKSAFELWMLLMSSAVSYPGLSIRVFIYHIQEKIHRSSRTIFRLLAELEANFFIERSAKGRKGVQIEPRLPYDILESCIIKARRINPLSRISAKNGRDSRSAHYYDNNINNNTIAESAVKRRAMPAKPQPIVFDMKKSEEEKAKRDADDKLREFCEKNVQDLNQEIEKTKEISRNIEIDHSEPSKGRLFREMLRVARVMTVEQKESVERLNRLEIKRDQFLAEIVRIENRWKPRPAPDIPRNGARQFSASDLIRIKRSVIDQRLQNEIFYSVMRGSLKDKAVPHAISIGLKLIRNGAWRTPLGYR